jgi:hypothetical protein
LEPKTLVWSRASGAQRNACRGTDEGSGGVAQGRQQKKAHDSSAFFSIGARYSLAHTKAAARSDDEGNTDFPLLLNWVGWALGKMLSIP